MTSIELDILGHFGYFFMILGMLLLANKNIWGWIIRWIGEATWLSIGINMGMSSIWFWEGVFLVVDIYGFYSWRKFRNLENYPVGKD